MQRADGKPGFTLIEVVLVIAIIGLIAAFVLPEVTGTSEYERLVESGRRFRAMVVMCRAEAMNETRPHRIEFWPDGTIEIKRQADPIIAPHLYIPIKASWARTPVLMENVWVSAVQVLPEGPPPIRIIDDQLEFPEMEFEPLPIEELVDPVVLEFGPDGSSHSMRWVLCDPSGTRKLLTLDGRLGRVNIEDMDRLPEDDVIRPEPIELEEKRPVVDFDPEDFDAAY